MHRTTLTPSPIAPAPRRGRRALVAMVLFATTWQPMLVPLAQAAAFSPPLIQLYDAPFLVGERIPPYVMLAVTKDQQLFKKAYDDFSDIDRDGTTDTTYKHAIDYYGYFDSYKCYNYSDGNKRFEPATVTANKYCSGNWSGNFLNWATMTRIDALRKVFYGGLRSPNRGNGDGSGLSDGDTGTTTVLERAFLPNDAHSFTKYYDGADSAQLTPFGNAGTSQSATPIAGAGTLLASSSINSVQKFVTVPSTAGYAVNEWVQLTASNGSYVRGQILAIFGAATYGAPALRIGNIKSAVIPEDQAPNIYVVGGTAAANAAATGWTLTNVQKRGITICNTTLGDNSGGIQTLSETNTNLPRMRIARGDYSLWNAQERWQCLWGNSNNGNQPAVSGLMAHSDAPNQASVGLDTPARGGSPGKGDYFVRVQACVSTLIGTERCKQYPSGNYKPIGMLQTFGETDRIRFGLMTGSYAKNLSGGVLRKNVSPITDEINTTTDGTFVNLPASGVPVSIAPGDSDGRFEGGSIIRTLSELRVVGYRYSDGTYFGGSLDDKCPYQRALNTNGECKSWGNPMSEIYYESLRYMSGATGPTSAFDANDTPYLSKLVTAKWPTTRESLISEKNYCAPLNVLLVNGAVSTNETDNQIGSLSFMDGSPGSAKQLTNDIGTEWGLTGGYFFGHADGAGAGSPGYDICSGKSLTGLGEVRGICPEGPTLNGSYLMAGMAFHAHMNKVRTDIPLPASAAKLKRPALRVDTYGVSIAGGIPRIPVKFAGDTAARVVIQPAYRLSNGTYGGGGALVDARVVRQVEEADRSYGQLMVSWEDSEAGGDYDMDVWGILNYEMERATNQITVTTAAVHQATGNPQGFGYVISGTAQDGLHFHSGILGFDYTDPTPPVQVTGNPARINASGGCVDCQQGDTPSSAVYNLATTPPANSLEDPLYYASLFGGFDDANRDGKPNHGTSVANVIQPSEYDKRNNLTGSDVPDGIPDNYFRVDNPLGLELGLERTFQLISEQSSMATLQASSTRIVAGSAVYQAKFNSGDWSGSLEALPIGTDGSIGIAQWNAATATLSPGAVDPDNRKILTMNASTRAPVGFRYANLSAAQQTALATVGAAAPDARAQDRLNYLRGETAMEGSGVAQFRRRTGTVLGDIVNSSPVHVGKPEAGIGGASYLAYVNAQASREPAIYVGANDGMLHAFSARDGRELFAYVPTPVYRNLAQLTAQDYKHQYFVDGQISTQDVNLGSGWRTYLVAGLGAGGQGVVGLDVTNPLAASEGAASTVVKWEFTDEDDPHMGYLFSHPIIRKLNNGDWVAIFSSGYNAGYDEGTGRHTTDGRPAIFMLKLTGPTGPAGRWRENIDYWRVDIPQGTAAAPNGVGGVASFDTDGDGTADYAYAGDLYGSIWRVDLTGMSTSTTSYSVSSIFQAKSAAGVNQAVTAAPALMVGPQYEGIFVLFGSGKMLEPKDLQAVSGAFPNHTLYGIWDKNPTTATSIVRNQLMAQKVVTTEGNSDYAGGSAELAQIDFSLTTAFVPNYTSTSRVNVRHGASDPLATAPTASTPPNQRGWYFDLPDAQSSGERAIYRPELVGPFAIFVNAIPAAVACEGGGSEAQYALEALTGGRSAFGGFDRDANGKIQGKNGSLLGDQSAFGGTFLAGGVKQHFYSSRRETTGGFGQMTIMKTVGPGGGAGGGAGTSVDACAGGGLAPIGAQSSTSGLILTQRLPGGCIGRVQWREVVRH